MKKLIVTAVAGIALCAGLAAIAQGTVVIRTAPAVITKQGDTFMVPVGTTSNYYYYTDADKRYVCTVDEPTELVGVQSRTISVRFGDSPRDVRCYTENYFTVEAP